MLPSNPSWLKVSPFTCVPTLFPSNHPLYSDILFSRELQESLSSAAQAKRVGESKVIAARAEVDAARLMREAADILSSVRFLSNQVLCLRPDVSTFSLPPSRFVSSRLCSPWPATVAPRSSSFRCLSRACKLQSKICNTCIRSRHWPTGEPQKPTKSLTLEKAATHSGPAPLLRTQLTSHRWLRCKGRRQSILA